MAGSTPGARAFRGRPTRPSRGNCACSDRSRALLAVPTYQSFRVGVSTAHLEPHRLDRLADWSHGWPGRRRRPHGRFRGPLRRSSDARVLAGVCGGISEATGIDVTLVRIGFVLLSVGSGIGFPVYALAWLLLPLQGENSTIFTRAITDRRGIRLVIATIPLFIVVQVLADGLHMGYLGSISWPVFLALGVAILIRRNASDGERVWINSDLVPMLSGDRQHRAGRWSGVSGPASCPGDRRRAHPDRGARDPRPLASGPAGVLLVIAAIVVVFAPWWLSLVRDLMSERQARARAEERAEMAAHVHDSVLQTLALIQRGADDPQQVVRLARAQERDLRSWLFEGRAPGGIGKEVIDPGRGDRPHPTPGRSRPWDHRPGGDGRRLSARRRDASAARRLPRGHRQCGEVVGGVAGLDLLRSRRWIGHGLRPRPGPRVRPGDRPRDRQGIASSICARMARFGGSATIRSAPGEGAEVELSMPRHELVS